MSPTTADIVVTEFEEEPSGSDITEGDFTFNQTCGGYDALAKSASEYRNILEWSQKQCPDLSASTEFIMSGTDLHLGIGARRVESDLALSSGWCDGTTGYACFIEGNSTDDDSVYYYYDIKYCNYEGEIETVATSSLISDSLSVGTEYILTFTLDGLSLDCSVADSDGNAVSWQSYTASEDYEAVHEEKGMVALLAYGEDACFKNLDAYEIRSCSTTDSPTQSPTAGNA